MAANVSYAGSPLAEKAIKEALMRRELRLTLTSDPLCVFQWSSFSKRNGTRHFAGLEESEDEEEEGKPTPGDAPAESVVERPLFTSSFNVRTALVRKDELANTLACACSSTSSSGSCGSGTPQSLLRQALPLSFVLNQGQLDEWRRRSMEVEPEAGAVVDIKQEGRAWVIKSSLVNNALGVTVERIGTLKGLPPERHEEVEGDSTGAVIVVAQEYVSDPVLAPVVAVSAPPSPPTLFSRHKFHMRVNVLVVPQQRSRHLSVFVHRDVICHIACEPYNDDGGGSIAKKDEKDDKDEAARRFRHLTNNGVQRSHPSYKRETHTITLQELCGRWAAEVATAAGAAPTTSITMATSLDLSEEGIFSRICWVVSALVSHLEECKGEGGRHPFVALPNSFEVFGFDFLLSHKGCGASSEDKDGGSKGPWPVLLEVNGGPALEGNAWPDKCKEVVEDTLRVVLDPWLSPQGATGTHDAEAEGSPVGYKTGARRETIRQIEGTNYWRVDNGVEEGMPAGGGYTTGIITEKLRRHVNWALEEEQKAKARAAAEEDHDEDE
jgi:Tubulin-tyrosine ligase family